MLGSRDYGITGKDNTVPRVGIRSMQHPEGRAAAMAARRTSTFGQKWWPQFAFKIHFFVASIFSSHVFKTSRGSLLAGLQAAIRARRRNAPISFSISACSALCASL